MSALTRAYSLLHVKAVDAERRIITGIATTPEPDRMGDIIEPLGVHYKNPLPLLLFHDTTNPVGTVRFKKPTETGVEFEAHLPELTEPSPVKTEIDKAWQLVKMKLVQGVSIGFRILNDAVDYMKDTGGYRYRETEVLELSLVVIPANGSARIQTIKSFDTSRPAAPGMAARVPSIHSGAPDRRTGAKAMNTAEQLTAKKAALKTKAARLEELMAKADGESLDRPELDEQDALTTDIKGLTAEVDRLETLEKAQAIQARPVAVGSKGDVPAAGNGHGQHITVEKTLPPGIEFTHYVKCLMVARGNPWIAIEVAKVRYPDEPRIQMLLKTAVTAHTTADGANTGGTELVYATNLTSEFIEFLRSGTILDRFGQGNVPSLRRVPFNVRVTGQTSGAGGNWVGQGGQKPLMKFDFSATSLTWAKVAAITVQSEELARFSSPSSDTLLRDALAGCLRERLDIDFIDPNKALVANVSPASITNGIAALVSSGTDAAAVRADLAALMGAFIAANNPLNAGVIITSQTTALTLQLMRNALGNREFDGITMNGGTLEGFPVITSQYAAALGSPSGNLLILLNASDIFLADDGGFTVDASREASLEMSDDPATDSGTELVSMYQTNQIAIRAERFINWARRRVSAVAWMQDVAYSSGSPA